MEKIFKVENDEDVHHVITLVYLEHLVFRKNITNLTLFLAVKLISTTCGQILVQVKHTSKNI